MRFTILTALTLGLFSCATPVQLPKDISSNKSILLPFRVDSIAFVDKRTDTLTYYMKLPLFATKTKDWVVNPGLSGELKAGIITLIMASSNPDGLPAFVTFNIEEGYYKISGSTWSVGEHARFDCKIEFKLVEANGYYKSNATAYHDYEGIFNATEKHVKETYEITVRNSVFKALKQAEKIYD